MAKNREHQRMAESDSDSTDNESQDSEPERTQTAPAAAAKKPPPKSASKPTPAAAAKNPPPKSASKPDSSSDSGSSDSDSDGPDSPIPTQPQKKSRSKTTAADPVTPAALKRPAAEEIESKKSKKKKKKKKKAAPAEPESSSGAKSTKKPSIIQRKWSEGDELLILEGMIDNPAADATALLVLFKDNLDRQDAMKSHLQGKIKKLKQKYENNWTKENEGKDMSSLNPHERKVYDLSKLVWGRNKRTVEEEAKEDTVSVWPASVKSIGVSSEERVLMIGDEMFESGKGDAAGAEEWKKLRNEGMKTFVRQMEIQTAQAKMVVDRLLK